MSARQPSNMRASLLNERRAPASRSTQSRPRAASGGENERERERESQSRSSTTMHSRKQSAPAGERRTEKREIRTTETEIRRTRSPLKQQSMRSRADKTSRSSGARKTPEETIDAPWAPETSLVPHTAAPLACRVTIPPLASTAPQTIQPQPLSQLSSQAQENAIIEDLLFVFMGFEGQYIRFAASYDPHEEKERLVGPQFSILPGLDPSLRDLTASMLKMATHYIAVEAFVEVMSRLDYGSVNHALCAAVRELLREYLILIGQLEHQMLTDPAFTLHILNLHTKQTSHMLFQVYTTGIELLKANGVLEDEQADDSLDDTDNLENILESIKDGGNLELTKKKVCKGGSVLGLITKRLSAMSGDPPARSLLTRLLRESSRPYMAMLNEWLHHGGIKDPHAEFLIKEQKSIKRERLDQDYTDEYWEKRYTIREKVIPPQLESVQERVLLAGKYLNVVRECGGVDVSKVVQDVPTTFDDPRFLDNVNAAYAYANSSLFNLLLTTHGLPARLRSLKHYFFLDRSDFFDSFMDLGGQELKKPAKHVNTEKLQSFLDFVLRQPGSVAAEDPFKEDVKVQMNEVGLTNWLIKIVNVTGLDQDAANSGSLSNYTPAVVTSTVTEDANIKGFEALVLDYAMPFPLSLVVSRVTLTRYQLLFRYLLSLRHLESLLLECWGDQGKTSVWKHRSKNPRIELWKRKAWTLRARMLVFVQQLLYFCTAEVIEPNWVKLMARLKQEGNEKEEDNGPNQVKRTVDELMQDHIDFLATCLKECMLTNSKLLKINNKITSVCTLFAGYTRSLTHYLIAADPEMTSRMNAQITAENAANRPLQASNRTSHAKTSSSGKTYQYDPQRVDKMFEVLGKYEDNFARHLRILLDTLNYLAATETVVFLSLCARLSSAGDGGDNASDVLTSVG